MIWIRCLTEVFMLWLYAFLFDGPACYQDTGFPLWLTTFDDCFMCSPQWPSLLTTFFVAIFQLMLCVLLSCCASVHKISCLYIASLFLIMPVLEGSYGYITGYISLHMPIVSKSRFHNHNIFSDLTLESDLNFYCGLHQHTWNRALLIYVFVNQLANEVRHIRGRRRIALI